MIVTDDCSFRCKCIYIEIIFQREKDNTFKSIYHQGTWIIAPDLFIAEITNVLWKYYKAGRISHIDCIQYVQDGIDRLMILLEQESYGKKLSQKE